MAFASQAGLFVKHSHRHGTCCTAYTQAPGSYFDVVWVEAGPSRIAMNA